MKAGSIHERHLAVIMRETLVALDYIHKAGIIHRDIKAANILVTRTGQPMLCDFGVAASFVQGGTRGKRTTFIGTPYWMAPEVITEGKTYDYKADIWSLGITAYEIATGNPPHAEQDQHRVIAMIPKNKPPRLPDGPYSPPMREFVAGCLDEDPNARLSAEELSRTKWIRAHAKTPVSVLRELLAQYASWTQAGGVRTSLIQGKDGPLALQLATEEPSAVPVEPEWKFESTGSDDAPAEPAPATVSPQPEPAQDHPLKRLFDHGEESGDRTAKPTPTATNTLRPPAAPAPVVQPPPSQPNRTERPAGSGFTGSGATPFRFGIGSRAEPKEAREPRPEPPASPKNDTGEPALSLPSRSPSLAALDEAEQGDSRTSPSASPVEAELLAPSLSQPSSPDDEDEDASPPSSPALRRVGRIPIHKRPDDPVPALRTAHSSSSLGLDALSKTPDEGRKGDAPKSSDIPSFLEEPFTGFRPQGAISRTRSRSGSVADLRGRGYLHQSSHSLSNRPRGVPMQPSSRSQPEPLSSAARKPVGTLPSSASLSVLPKPEEKVHRRKQHGGSDPTLLTTPLSTFGHARKVSDPPPQLDEAMPLPPRRTVPTLPDAEKDVFHTPATELFEGPPLRPLDLANLMNRQELHTELMQTVNDLSAWLDAVALGLATVLTPPPP